MPFMKKRSLTTGICTAGIFMFSQEKSENGSLGRKSNGKGASRKDRAPKKKKKLVRAKIERLLSRNSPSIPMPSCSYRFSHA